MNNSVFNYIPSPKQEKDVFMVKGLRLPFYDSENSLVQLIGNYFVEKENVIVFTSPFSGKIEALREILKDLDNSVVFSNNPCLSGNLIFSSSLLRGRDYAVFYNVPVPFECFEASKIHISAFYDYEILPSESYEEYIARATEGFPSTFEYTVVCTEPNKKDASFLFGTDPSIKHICLNQINDKPTVVFSEIPLSFQIKNIEFVQNITNELKARQFVFYDLSIPLISTVLKKVDKTFFIYTVKDFPVLKHIVKVLESNGFEIPEHIKKISSEN